MFWRVLSAGEVTVKGSTYVAPMRRTPSLHANAVRFLFAMSSVFVLQIN